MTSLVQIPDDLLYPSSDGNPMADSTIQYRWIVTIKENLDRLFKDDPKVFVAADLLWYPVQVNVPPAPSQAPDVMVVFGVSKGDRRSYQQFKENNIPPQVVFEILSDSNKTAKGKRQMQDKLDFYQQHGVEEYYLYDPDEFILQGWQRRGNRLLPIANLSQWVSPRLKIRFDWQQGQELTLYDPDDQQFLSFQELSEQVKQERFQKELAQQQELVERQRAEQERQRAEQERQRAEQERQRAEQERQRAEQERNQKELAQQRELAERNQKELAQQRADQLAEYLRSLGINPDEIAGQ